MLFKTEMEKIKFSSYVADYIQEELNRGVSANDIGIWLIADAIDAFEGGAFCDEKSD